MYLILFYRCFIKECDSGVLNYNESYLTFSVPLGKYDLHLTIKTAFQAL